MNMEAMNKKFRLLLEKYLPGERAELVADSDIGTELRRQIEGLKQLLAAYRSGAIKETNLH